MIKDYSKINSMWDVLVNDIDEVADKTRFTQLEKDFVVAVSYTHLTLPTKRIV